MFPASQFHSIYFVRHEKLYFVTKQNKTNPTKIVDTLCLAICLAGFHNDVLTVLKCCQHSVDFPIPFHFQLSVIL